MTRTRFFLAGCAAFISAAIAAASIQAPDVPDDIKAAAGLHVVLRTHGWGSQVYVCGHGESGAGKWLLKGPDAVLRDGAGKTVGQHSAGPTWTYKDGSAITAKAVAHIDALDPAAIPWLKLEVTSHSGKGLLEHVTTVLRVRTRGGQSPAATQCTPANQNDEARVPYTADYYFYAPADAGAR